jgi:hypothetical protein
MKIFARLTTLVSVTLVLTGILLDIEYAVTIFPVADAI